jgi:hypothetical protein
LIANIDLAQNDSKDPFGAVNSKWGHLENTNQSHCRRKIEKINKRHISQSALGQKQFEQINECQTVKIGL